MGKRAAAGEAFQYCCLVKLRIAFAQGEASYRRAGLTVDAAVARRVEKSLC